MTMGNEDASAARLHGALLFAAAQMAAVLSVLPAVFEPIRSGLPEGPIPYSVIAGFAAVAGAALLLLGRGNAPSGWTVRVIAWCSSTALAVCSVLAACCQLAPEAAPWALSAIALLAFAGLASQTALWANAYAGYAFRTVMVNTAASFALFSVCVLSFAYLPVGRMAVSSVLFAVAAAGGFVAVRMVRMRERAFGLRDGEAPEPHDSFGEEPTAHSAHLKSASAAEAGTNDDIRSERRRLFSLFTGVGALGCWLAAFTLPFALASENPSDNFGAMAVAACVILAACAGFFLHGSRRMSDNQLRFKLFEVALPSLALVAFAIKMIPIALLYDTAFRSFMELYFLILAVAFWMTLALLVRANPALIATAAGTAVAVATACTAAGSAVSQMDDNSRNIILGLVTAAFLVAAIVRTGRNLATFAKGAESEGDLYEPFDMAQACAKVGERYHLTRRESEVLGELAYGHSSTYIAEVLFISTNTVRTHMKNIYRKLGVGSREDVIEILRRDQG